ncbi:hypothetical protein [Singulisphaera sp. PoT]|uniref:hypothetical protein n=1 Tax=Singulisphaera sp. PoT TaxID=3411797 RepID=UPI003BF5EB82
MNRRTALSTFAACLSAGLAHALAAPPTLRLATFSADVTPPLGHPLMGGGIAPAKKILEPLWAKGFVLLGAGKPIVVAAIDWCEIRNDAYERWREALAEAAGTEPARVVVTSLHQHDTPIADLTAEHLLDQHKAKGSVCDVEFHEKAVRDVAKALAEGLKTTQSVTHVGMGQAKVEKVASNRRYIQADGKPGFNRMSATRDPAIRDQPEGVIDPWLKTISLWDGDQPLLALSCYATHPMSFYGQGDVNTDFVGMARKKRQEETPTTFQIYTSGCSGNITAGKYNDGSPANRPILAERIRKAMAEAWQNTKVTPIDRPAFKVEKLRVEPRDSEGFKVAELEKRMDTDPKPFGQCLAALGLSWRARADVGKTIDVPVLALGKARLLLLPGESYVEYQLYAQATRPDLFVVTMGYGESATGYIPTEHHFEENDGNLNDWCWVAPGSEDRMKAAIRAALRD